MPKKPEPKKKRTARHLAEDPGSARAVITACGAYVLTTRTSEDVEEVICRECRMSKAAKDA